MTGAYGRALVLGAAVGLAVAAVVMVRAPTPPRVEAPKVDGASKPGAPFAAPSVAVPPGHPAIPGHPRALPSVEGAHAGKGGPMPPRFLPSLTWKVPSRWIAVPHVSSMRIATFAVPHVAPDAEDAEVSVTRAGGDLEVNADRWIGQFDLEARKTAKKTPRTIAGVASLFVEVRGAYQGFDMKEPEPGWMLLGAIVGTPHGAHFFKLVGPAKSVEAARGELESLLGSLADKPVDKPEPAAGTGG